MQVFSATGAAFAGKSRMSFSAFSFVVACSMFAMRFGAQQRSVSDSSSKWIEHAKSGAAYASPHKFAKAAIIVLECRA